MPRGSGAGVIFRQYRRCYGSCCKKCLLFSYKEQPDEDLLKIEAIRGLAGVREASCNDCRYFVRVAIVHGTDNARKFIAHMEETKTHYDFVEVMTCPGGCIGGGGQPKHIGEDMQDIRKKRIASLYDKDASMSLRNSHDNPHIKAVYEEFYGTPLSDFGRKIIAYDLSDT